MSDSNDARPGPRPANNPEGEIAEPAATTRSHEGRNVSGDEADAAGKRATKREPVTRDDVIDQAAYKDNAADVGQQAADAEQGESDPTT